MPNGITTGNARTCITINKIKAPPTNTHVHAHAHTNDKKKKKQLGHQWVESETYYFL